MRMRHRVVAGALLCAPALHAVAAEPAPPPAPVIAGATTKAWSPITSHRRNFVVTAMPHRDALEIAIWAESVVDLLVDSTGMAVPSRGMMPLVIAAELHPDRELGGVRAAQDFSANGRLRQELIMVNPAEMDQEDVLERLVGLLMNRWLAGARAPGAGRVPPAVPEWLATGVAQNMYPALRARNSRMLKQAGEAGLWMSASSLFDQQLMPPGRWPEKALAGLVVAWMAERGGRQQWLRQVLTLVEQQPAVRAVDLLGLVNAGSVREFDMAWDVWFFEQERRLVAGSWSRSTVELERLVAMRTEDTGLVHPDFGPGSALSPDDLINARRQQWAREVAKGCQSRLGQLMIGMAPDVTEVAERYVVFYREVAADARSPTAMSSVQLRLQWEEAVRALDHFRRAESARKELLDAYALPVVEPSAGDVRALEQMLDAWE